MNIRVHNGKRTITLTKAERGHVIKTRDLVGELSKQCNGHVQQAALAGEAALTTVLAEFPADAAKSEPEATEADMSEE